MGAIKRRKMLNLTVLGSLNWALGCVPKAPLGQLPPLAPTPLNEQRTALMKDTVLVIGAGIAGIAAARILHAQGLKVTILEGRDRIGGRIWTDYSWTDTPIDLGASWMNSMSNNPIVKLVNEFKINIIQTQYHAPASIYTTDGKLLTENEQAGIKTRFQQVMSKLEREREALNHDLPLSTAFERAINSQNLPVKQQRELRHFIHALVEQDYAADAKDLSLWYWDEADDFYGGDAIFPGGYEQIIDKLAAGLDIKLKQIVQKIEYNDKRVKLTTNQGVFEARRAIVTVPLGVLQSGAVTFSPPLPQRKAAAIKNLRMGVLNKLWLRFPQCFWPKDSEWFEYIGSEIGVWSEFFNFFKYSGKPIIVALNVGTHSRELEKLSDQAIVAEAMKVLRQMYGTSIPNPDAWQVTRWASDTFAGGSYSYISPGATGRDYDALAAPVGQSLFFAGEATHRKQYGTVQGAYLSGVQAAKAIVELAIANSPLLIASKNSRIYHVSPDCLDVQNIPPENRIEGPAASKGRKRHLDCPRKPSTPEK
ncbi:FAD-dependent oxidoreductase [Nostoc sp. CHAB 5836]|uniref:flavin monoamine oxidase family protein n=1 Tax=Nostoc sp. CHAB 5836 TaxID=2780404 RepID=UPI001E64721A|nr:FAD-dependent oxidoreductase [Nostoc sp. CHAB 5836]MCC5619303.1 FAD-dependent oxidoreductase [Nostoc sp. CHAB 5836]